MINHYIFVSYDSDDYDKVLSLINCLRSNEYTFLIAKRDILPSRSWVKWMNQALSKSDLFLLIWSSNAARSRYVNDELEAFYINRQKERIFSILLDETEMPNILKPCQHFKYENLNSIVVPSFQQWVNSFEKTLSESDPDAPDFSLLSISSKDIDYIVFQLASARKELSPIHAASLFKDVVKKSLSLISEFPSQASILASAALSELALFENNISKRSELRRESILICKNTLKSAEVAAVAIAYANRTVDAFYDSWAYEDRPQNIKNLIEAKHTLERFLRSETDLASQVSLLVQLSSILRCQAQLEHEKNNIRNRASEAVRVSELALKKDSQNKAAKLELGQALSAFARTSKSDKDYYSNINNAEEILLECDDGTWALPLLVLARFYRQTYRPMAAYECFKNYMLRETKIRRMLSESFILAEAAMQMWYQKYDEEFTREVLQSAKDLIHKACNSGYENARLLVDLAQIESALGSYPLAEIALKRLSKMVSGSWSDAIMQAVQAIEMNKTDLIHAFAIGLIDSKVWNGLGTYVRNFMHDNVMALRFYETGKRINHKDHVILTNIARTLIDIGDNGSLDLAKSVLEQAMNYADRSFIWWREVQSKLFTIKGIREHHIKSIEKPSTRYVSNFKELRKQYQYVISQSDAFKKEMGFRDVVLNLLKISYGPQETRLNALDSRFIEFIWRNDRYLVIPMASEIHNKYSDIYDIIKINEEKENRFIIFYLDEVPKDIFSTINSFLPKNIVLIVDRKELDLIFNASLRLDICLDKKLVEIYGIINAARN